MINDQDKTRDTLQYVFFFFFVVEVVVARGAAEGCEEIGDEYIRQFRDYFSFDVRSDLRSTTRRTANTTCNLSSLYSVEVV